MQSLVNDTPKIEEVLGKYFYIVFEQIYVSFVHFFLSVITDGLSVF